MKPKDYTGQKYNKLTLIKRLDKKIRDSYLWEAQCDCGNIIEVQPTTVKRGKRRSCGCFITEKQKHQYETLSKNKSAKKIGKKIGRLTVIECVGRSDKLKKKPLMYLCLCDCGNTKIIPGSNLRISEIKNNAQSCGCLQKERSAKFLRKGTGRDSTARNIWGAAYSDGCPLQTFLKLSQMNCEYCGTPPSNSANRVSKDCAEDFQKEGLFIYNGLDRVNNSLLHSIDNVVPCCKWCNKAKSNRSIEEFKEWITQAYNHWISQLNTSSEHNSIKIEVAG